MTKKIVQCPHCDWKQKTQAKKSVKCVRCEKSFLLRPKSERSRIVKVVG